MNDIIPLPEDAPKVGERFRHYKGRHYEVFELAFHENDHEWMVVYKPLYDDAGAHLFVRPFREWNERIEWEGGFVKRFTRFDV